MPLSASDRAQTPTRGDLEDVKTAVEGVNVNISNSTFSQDSEKAGDTSHQVADKGLLAHAVRRDADTGLATADGKRAPPLVDDKGRLKTRVLESALPAGAATEATLAGIKTGTDKIPASPATTADVEAVRDRLPATGAASADKQDTVIAALADLLSELQQKAEGSIAVSNMIPAVETGLAKEAGGNLAALAAKDFATQATLALIKAKTDNIDLGLTALRDALRGVDSKTLSDLATLLAGERKVRSREEDAAKIYFSALGPTDVGIGAFVTLASVTVPAGKKLRLLHAEGDFEGIAAVTNKRGLRIQKAGATRATAYTGSDQPNPDIEGLVLENTSAGNETWTLQGTHNAVTTQSMVGWFVWVEIND